MDGTDRKLALIARNHNLLPVAAEIRERARETRAAAERLGPIAVRRAVLCAAAAGGWQAAQPGRDV